MKENEIIKGCINRSKRHQRAFVDTYSPYIFGICRRYFRDTNLAKDCLQESLIKILWNIENYKEKGKFKAWVAKITVMECLQNIRKNKKYWHLNLDTTTPLKLNENIHLELTKLDIITFLDGLPDNYRIVLNMYFIDDYSHKKISKLLGISEGTSRSLVSRGREKIKQHFKNDNAKLIQISLFEGTNYLDKINKK